MLGHSLPETKTLDLYGARSAIIELMPSYNDLVNLPFGDARKLKLIQIDDLELTTPVPCRLSVTNEVASYADPKQKFIFGSVWLELEPDCFASYQYLYRVKGPTHRSAMLQFSQQK